MRNHPSESGEVSLPGWLASSRGKAAGLGLIALAYYAAACLGLVFEVQARGITAAWPPSGLVLGLVLALPRRSWPALLATIALTNAVANLVVGHPWAYVVGFSLVDAIEGAAGGWVVTSILGRTPSLSRVRDVLVMLFGAAAGSNAVTALAGAGIAVSVSGAPFWGTWATWWVSNGIGMLLVAPLVLSLAEPRSVVPPTRREQLELAGLYLALAAVGSWVFSGRVSSPALVPLPYVTFPALLWAGLRFGPLHAAAGSLTIAILAAWHTARGAGPFVAVDDPAGALLALQAFMGVVSVSALVAAAVVAERRRAEESLEVYQQFTRHAADAVLFIRVSDGQILDVNGAAEAAYGYTADEFRRLNLADLASAPPEVVRERMRRADREGLLFETVHRRRDATTFPVEVHARGATLNGERLLFSVHRDVSERQALEDRLRQAQKMEAVGRLAGGIAHDFNNLLTVIKGYTEIALLELGGKSPSEPLEEVKKAADRATGVTRQLLAFSRKQILEPSLLDANAIVGDMDRMLRRLIGEHIELSTVAAPEAWPIYADRGQIEQVVLNLVLNARDAMPAGGRLTIETANAELDGDYVSRHPEARPGPFVMLAVTDTGAGLTPEAREHVFEPFFTTKARGRGTGLGLSTVYGIVRQSGGHVTFSSETGRGTTFRVYLPADRDAVPAASRQPHAGEACHGRETILLAEDDSSVRGLASKLLASWGYRVLVAEGGAEAIELSHAETAPIDLLLTDVVMPRVGGRDVANQLVQERPGLKVLFMSGYTEDAIVHQGVLDSDVELIQKPFSPDALGRKIREVLDRRA
jgi:PAS domain S-box-containing protein